VSHLLQQGTSVYTVSSERPVPTTHSGIRTCDARIIRSLHRRHGKMCYMSLLTILKLKIQKNQLKAEGKSIAIKRCKNLKDYPIRAKINLTVPQPTLFFHPDPKTFYLKIYFWEFCLPLQPWYNIINITVESVFKTVSKLKNITNTQTH
jgi:hypothetical protein